MVHVQVLGAIGDIAKGGLEVKVELLRSTLVVDRALSVPAAAVQKEGYSQPISQ